MLHRNGMSENDPDAKKVQLPPTVASNQSIPVASDRNIDPWESLSTGDSIGRYVVARKIGSGSFGVVYLAHDHRLQRDVAIKISRLSARDEDLRTISLLNEARAVAAIDHPNVVRVHDVDQVEDRTYIVMEFVQGVTLSDRIAESGTLTLDFVTQVIRQICEALTSLHQRGVIHRDLKPSNVLLTKDGIAKVTDFGLALTDDSPLWNQKQRAGTERYMAPEQVLGEVHRIDGRTDLWAIGVMFYEMLTGSSPFRAKDRQALFDKILSDDPLPVRQKRPELPPIVDHVCCKCMSKSMADRYQSAMDLIEDLSRVSHVSISGMHSQIGLQKFPDAMNRPSHVESASMGSETGRSLPPTQWGSTALSNKWMPRGLRPFTHEDAGFFLALLPGAKDALGFPNSVQFWRRWVASEERTPTHSVGVIYGPSGCGKSSFVQAALIPNLADSIRVSFFDFTTNNPISSLKHALQQSFPETNPKGDLATIVSTIRRRTRSGKVLLVFDQFEQYLIRTPINLQHEMVQALRQCDGASLKCLILVRDEFWMEISQFMAALESPLSDTQNAMSLPLFSPNHAKRVLMGFGRAYELLPPEGQELTPNQIAFVDKAIEGMTEENSVICVRIAMFAELMTSYPWEPATLQKLGGVDGIAIQFLHDNFSSKKSPMSRRAIAPVCVDILQSLLPDDELDLKATATQISAIEFRDGSTADSERVQLATHCLEEELKLITRSASGSAEADHYHLAHDYLVKPIKAWVKEVDQQTWRGRGIQLLLDYDRRYSRNPSAKNLPSTIDSFRILAAVPKRLRSSGQSAMLYRAALFASMRIALWAATSIVVLGLVWNLVSAFNANRKVKKEGIARSMSEFLRANPSDLQDIYESLIPRGRTHSEERALAREQLAYFAPIFVDEKSILRLSLLDSLVAPTLQTDSVAKGLSTLDVHELSLIAMALDDAQKQKQFKDIVRKDIVVPSLPQAAWVSALRGDWEGLRLLDQSESPEYAVYFFLTLVSQDLPSASKFDFPKIFDLAKSSPQGSVLPRAACLTYGLCYSATDSLRDSGPSFQVFLSEWARSKHASLAMSAKWTLARLKQPSEGLGPVDTNAEWCIDDPEKGHPFVLLELQPDIVTSSVGNQKKILSTSAPVWMAATHVTVQDWKRFDAAFDPNFLIAPESQQVLPVSSIQPSMACKYCNWLSQKAGFRQAYFFEDEASVTSKEYRSLSSKILWDPTADGYRLPTESEMALAAIAGDAEQFAKLFQTESPLIGMLVPDPRNARKTVLFPLPNAYGFFSPLGNGQELTMVNQVPNPSLSSPWTMGMMRYQRPQAVALSDDGPLLSCGLRLVRGKSEP